MNKYSTVRGPPHTGGPGQTAPVAPPPVGGTASKEPYLTRLRTSGVTFGGILPRRSSEMPKRGATKAELQQQIKELQRKLNEAQAVAKERDRDDLGAGGLSGTSQPGVR